jgi:hypothetical protein
VRPEVRRVRDCPYRARVKPRPGRGPLFRFRCTYRRLPCLWHGSSYLFRCVHYCRAMRRAIRMPERRGAC